MKVRVIGDITGLSEDLQEKIIELEKASKDNTGNQFYDRTELWKQR